MAVDAPTEQTDPLRDKLDEATELDDAKALVAFNEIIGDARTDDSAMRIKELAVYKVGAVYQKAGDTDSLGKMTQSLRPFFATIPQAKTAKIVRTIIEMVAAVPGSSALEEKLCKECVAWCVQEKRAFLRLRIENRLAVLLFNQEKYVDALDLVNGLLREVKKMDDKNLLVEIHLTESHIHHALRAIAKAKAALTASRTAANSIYVTPRVQASIDMMSGTLHAEESDYRTSYSYFFEAFEAFNSLDDPNANKCFVSMLLCKVMSEMPSDVQALVNGKSGIKYAGVELDAMRAVSKASADRSLEDFQAALDKYTEQLSERLIDTHLRRLYDQILEKNLVKIIEPFSCVEINHVASLIKLDLALVIPKLSQMILDKKFGGTLDEGKGHLIVHQENDEDEIRAYKASLETITNMGSVMDSLFTRAEKLIA
jgi:26S proteasome regulatory subunit N6